MPQRPSQKPSARSVSPSKAALTRRKAAASKQAPEHEGATEAQVGDRRGPGAGYDDEPKKVRGRGGVA